METFNLVAKVTVSAYTKVRANNLEDAIKAAQTRGVELGGESTPHDPREVWIIEEADGMASNILSDA